MPDIIGFVRWRAASFMQKWARPYWTTVRHDLSRGRRTSVTAGARHFASRIAIYLLYPQHGLQRSHERSVAYLAQKGFSVIAVSNLPLNDTELARLVPLTHVILQRPNTGYDFGGYRDGVLHVSSRRSEIEQLVLLNDSVWFPLPEARDWIDDVTALQRDFVGAASNLGLDMVEPGNADAFVWQLDTKNPLYHYCSYALSFGTRIVRDVDFWRFWQRFRITDDKLETVRRGEVGLSQWIMRQGYSHASTLPIYTLSDVVRDLTDDRLLTLLYRIIVPQEPALRSAIDNFLENRSTTRWRASAEKMLLNAIARTGASYVSPDLMAGELRFPFLKKSPLSLDPQGKEETLRFIHSLRGDIGSEMLAEAQQIIAARIRS